MNKKLLNVINHFYEDLSNIEGLEVEDIILYGSTVTGDYKEARGDIDFLVFLKNHISTSQMEAIFKLHDAYREKDDMYAQLEGTYYTHRMRGLYIGTSRKGWKAIDKNIHGYIEQAMILSDYYSLKNKVDIHTVFIKNDEEISHEIDRLTKEIDKLSNTLKDMEFNIYGIQTLARCIYTKCYGGFASKSEAVSNLLSKDEFKEYTDVLCIVKSIRYPYKTEELKTLNLDETTKILSKLILYIQAS